jgi:hypothetical protein
MIDLSFLRWLLCLLAVIGASSSASRSSAATSDNPAGAAAICPASTATQGAFADLFLKAARRAGHFENFVYDEREFRLELKRADGAEYYVYLSNAHADYCKAAEADRASVVDRYVRSVLTQPAVGKSTSRQSLLPAVRGRALHEFLDLMLAIDGAEVTGGRYHRTLGSDIAVSVASDSESQIALLTDETITDLGLDYEQALRIATDNLRRVSNDNWIEIGPSLFQSGWKDDYDPARLLLADVIKKLPIKGDPVALAIDNNTLLVTGSKNKQGLLDMASLGRKMLEETTRPLSGQAIVLTDAGWADFLPDDAELRPLCDVQREQLNRDYGRQKELLQRLYELRHEDVFVASYMLVVNKGRDDLTSYAVWTKGVPTLLPHTDRIAFVDLDTTTKVDVAWSAVERIAGHRMKRTDIYPERYRVEDFPSLSELQELKAAATAP